MNAKPAPGPAIVAWVRISAPQPIDFRLLPPIDAHFVPVVAIDFYPPRRPRAVPTQHNKEIRNGHRA